MGDEAAWQVGRDQYLAIQTCEDGYDYTLFEDVYKRQTYNTSGASHVGIYVGNGMMIHCGDPRCV